jgi:hypothetical protein
MNALQDPLRNGAITLPGAHQLTLTGIVFAGEPTDTEFSAIQRIAQTVERAQAWLVGDVVVEYVRRLLYARPGLTVVNAVAEYALANGMQIEVVRSRYDISRFYPHADRNPRLTWSHHWVLNAFGFRLPECRIWLKRAEDGNWTIAQLRAEIKAVKRPKLPPEPTLPSICPDWLRDAIDHASGCLRDVDAMPPDAARTLLAEAEPLAAYIDALRAKVAPDCKDLRDLQSQQGKESITAAA